LKIAIELQSLPFFVDWGSYVFKYISAVIVYFIYTTYVLRDIATVSYIFSPLMKKIQIINTELEDSSFMLTTRPEYNKIVPPGRHAKYSALV